MRVAFAFLLLVASACATVEVEATQGRIYDLWLKDLINRFIKRVIENDWDPKHVEKHNFEIVLISRQAEARGSLENLVISGASDIHCSHISYNILLGRLDWDCVHRGVRASVEHADVELIYGDIRGKGFANGNLNIRDIRIKGNVLLKHDHNGRPWIYNINVDFGVGEIKADLTVVGNQDYSEQVNHMLNVRIPDYLITFRYEINTVVGELIRRAVELYQDREERIA